MTQNVDADRSLCVAFHFPGQPIYRIELLSRRVVIPDKLSRGETVCRLLTASVTSYCEITERPRGWGLPALMQQIVSERNSVFGHVASCSSRPLAPDRHLSWTASWQYLGTSSGSPKKQVAGADSLWGQPCIRWSMEMYYPSRSFRVTTVPCDNDDDDDFNRQRCRSGCSASPLIRGVLIASNLSFAEHISHKVARACLVHKCFWSTDISTLVRAFITCVRPLLKYCSCVWSPYLKNSICKVESVLGNFTKKLRRLSNLSDSNRLITGNN